MKTNFSGDFMIAHQERIEKVLQAIEGMDLNEALDLLKIYVPDFLVGETKVPHFPQEPKSHKPDGTL